METDAGEDVVVASPGVVDALWEWLTLAFTDVRVPRLGAMFGVSNLGTHTAARGVTRDDGTARARW